MPTSRHFQALVEAGNPIGEVVSVNRFLVSVSGLSTINPQALVLFEDGSKGVVNHVLEESVKILHLGSQSVSPGTGVVLQHKQLLSKVGKSFIGRVVSVSGDPLDGKGPVVSDETWPVFKEAPPLIERQELNEQIETGISTIDMLFPWALGQRVAIIGDSKSGKSTLATQITINQKKENRVVVYGLIAKRPSDINTLLNRLTETGAMDNTVVVVSTSFDSLVSSYLLPYVACSIAEYFWLKQDMDTVIIYDDLTTHAHAYREISLLGFVNPGRDSYPGDMFYAHSSLLERAGRISKTGKSLTAIPLALAAAGDITAFLPTNIMSITDGQLILDMDIFRNGIRPAISTGLSVSRVGGRSHTDRQKSISSRIMEALASYYQAVEFAHFGSELALEVSNNLERGRKILAVLKQKPIERFSLMDQQLMLDIVLEVDPATVIDIDEMKKVVGEMSTSVKDDSSYESVKSELKKKILIEVKK